MKVNSSRVLHISHFEAVQNVVRLHKASSNAALEEVSALASSNSRSIEEFLDEGAIEANSVFDDLQDALSSHQGETAHLARELRQKQSRSDAEKLIADMTTLVSGCIRR
ncbi:kinesin-related protein [Forsythia ovata]|uniref:Kinesin-related protein n=1 Tax=Forsythia ovata TaxID=205694 RepID=A0ABD1V0S1_9LAMI